MVVPSPAQFQSDIILPGSDSAQVEMKKMVLTKPLLIISLFGVLLFQIEPVVSRRIPIQHKEISPAANIPEKAKPVDPVVGDGPDILKTVAPLLLKALSFRKKYMEKSIQPFSTTTASVLFGIASEISRPKPITTQEPTPNPEFELPTSIEQNPFANKNMLSSHNCRFSFVKGIMHVKDDSGEIIDDLANAYISRDEFFADYRFLLDLLDNGPLRTYSEGRLARLRAQFELHQLSMKGEELVQQIQTPHRDFLSVRKVDNHVHAGRCYTQQHFLRFVKQKIQKDGKRVVAVVDGTKMTLLEVFQHEKIVPSELDADSLHMFANHQALGRFDLFNKLGVPAGSRLLQLVFLDYENYIEGEYYADLIKDVMREMEDSKTIHAEIRLSLYGNRRTDWDMLAKWVVNQRMHSRHVRWLIQLPRIYPIYRSKNQIGSFQEMLDNVFSPLFEVTNDPNSNPELHALLRYIVGFDLVDDESKAEKILFGPENPTPDKWTSEDNPPYGYYLFYFYANLAVLNQFRRHRGLNTFDLRPHSGEAGSVEHLVSAFMTSASITHGLKLEESPALEYLYYLCQVGVSMAPASNNELFTNYNQIPFHRYFKAGLMVALSTDDPLQFHHMDPPLMDEYSTAAKYWKLDTVDLCELARNSLIQSSFPPEFKRHWLGANYEKDGLAGHDASRTNVPDIRIEYRHQTLVDELKMLSYDESASIADGIMTRSAGAPVKSIKDFLAHQLSIHGKGYLFKLFGLKAAGIDDAAVSTALSESPRFSDFMARIGLKEPEVEHLRQVFKKVTEHDKAGLAGMGFSEEQIGSLEPLVEQLQASGFLKED